MISVVIPVVDEEQEIGPCLESLGSEEVSSEFLVVDGGSRDRTRELAEDRGARVLVAPRGRARQMNRGAAAAEGTALLFLHADMRLPPRGLDAVRIALEDPRVAGGGFRKRYQPGGVVLDLIAWGQNLVRAGWFRDLVGTNAIFVRREVFVALGGFPEVPFLEDVIFSDRLKQVGRVAILAEPVTVSSRKYQRQGILRRTARNLWIMAQFRLLGRTPEQLVAQYRRP